MKLFSGPLLAIVACAFALSQSQPSSHLRDIKSHLASAENALRAGDQETAKREFRSVLSLDPANAEAHANLGAIAFSRGDCSEASGDLRAALRSRPLLVKAEAMLGICEKRLGEPLAEIHLASAFAKLQEPNLRVQVGMELVGLCYEEGNADRALPVVQKMVEIDPDNPDILYTAQRLYNELADDTLNKLALIAPNSARMEQTIAERLVNAGDLQSAIVHYKKALDIDPRLPAVHYELAEAILQSGAPNANSQAAAKQEIEQARKLEGNSSKLDCLLGSIDLQQGDLQQANARYAEALELNPADSEAQLGLGRVLMMMEKPEQARKYLQMAVKSDPLNVTAHYRLATADRRLGLLEEAQKEARLTDEIKHAKLNVEKLYREMHKATRPEEPSLDQDQ